MPIGGRDHATDGFYFALTYAYYYNPGRGGDIGRWWWGWWCVVENKIIKGLQKIDKVGIKGGKRWVWIK